MTMIGNLLRSAIAGVAAIVLLAPAPARAQDKIRLTSSAELLIYSTVYTADLLGFFKQQNIATSFTLQNSGNQTIQAVLSDNADIVMGALTSVNARNSGADMVMIGATMNQYGANVVISKKWADEHKVTAKSPYKEKLAALKGITMGVVAPGGGADQLARYLAAEAGIDPDREMTIVGLGGDPAVQLAALQQDRISGLVNSAPVDHLAMKNFGAVRLFNLEAGDVPPLDGYLGSALAARGEWLKKNDALVVRFFKALQMAHDVMLDPARTNQARDAVHNAYFKAIDNALFAELWTDQVSATPKTPALTRKMIADLIGFYNRFNKEQLPAALVDTAFTADYVDRAMK